MNRNRFFALGVFFLVLMVLVYITQCPKKEIKIDHIYLITIDTLRADHLGCYGYPRNTSPFIDSLAKRGILFTRAYSQSATTGPSHASIFTGLYPFQHKVLANGLILDDSYTILAEILNQNGFMTAGFTSTSAQFKMTKINQGFEYYNDPSGTLKMIGGKYRSARLSSNLAMTWLSNLNPQKKLFMWIHIFDPHIPYRPPSKYIKTIERSLKKEEFLEYMARIPVDLEIFKNESEKMYHQITQYDAEIRYVDKELKCFFKYVIQEKLNKNALWIITSDHGEGLGQHQWYTHGKMLYQEAIHVPLIFYFTNKKIIQQTIDDTVENFDIFPTVLKVLNIKINKKLENEVKAVSLWQRIINAESNIPRKYTFSQRRKFFKNNHIADAPNWKIKWENGEKYCIQNENFKYILRTEYPDEFYSLTEDIFELKNQNDNSDYQKEKNSLKKIMYKILDDAKRYEHITTQMSNKKNIKKLKTLGYIE